MILNDNNNTVNLFSLTGATVNFLYIGPVMLQNCPTSIENSVWTKESRVIKLTSKINHRWITCSTVFLYVTTGTAVFTFSFATSKYVLIICSPISVVKNMWVCDCDCFNSQLHCTVVAKHNIIIPKRNEGQNYKNKSQSKIKDINDWGVLLVAKWYFV